MNSWFLFNEQELSCSHIRRFHCGTGNIHDFIVVSIFFYVDSVTYQDISSINISFYSKATVISQVNRIISLLLLFKNKYIIHHLKKNKYLTEIINQ
jgi:hypothetical protein